MNKLKFFIGIGAFALTMFSCSDNDINIDNGQGGELTETEFKKLGIFTFESEEGENADEGTESRTPASVDDYGRPSSKYMLDYVGMFSANITPKDQNNPPVVGEVADVDYNVFSEYKEYHFKNNSLELSYSIENDNKQADNCTINGVLTLTDGENSTQVNLSVIELDKLQEIIKLNDFTTDKKIQNPRGSSLFFLTYNPNQNSLGAENSLNLPVLDESDLKEAYGILKDEQHETLYDEYSDRLFLSSELLVFATEDKIYFYEVILKGGGKGGYYLYKTYDRNGSIQTSNLTLRRVTSIVNASFMLIDQQTWNENSYFKMSGGKGDKDASEKAYFEKYEVNLSGMTCKYATIDGINTVYNINNRESEDNTSDVGRLVLWTDTYQTVAPDGKPHDKKGEYSADVSYGLGTEEKARGLGIMGNSYSVVFKGSVVDTAGEDVNFYVTVDGVNIKITATINLKTGIALGQNHTHNIIVMINAEKFAEAVKKLKKQASSRAGSNEYATFEVPEGSVVVQ